MVGLTWWSRLAAVARTATRATHEANPIWGGVHASSWGVSMHQKGVSTYQLPIGIPFLVYGRYTLNTSVSEAILSL